MKVLLTGSTGFIGKMLINHLSDYDVTLLLRRNSSTNFKKIVTPIENFISSAKALCNEGRFDVVIHLAGLAHEPHRTKNEFEQINRDATLALAENYAMKGLKRFIFLSTIGVNGSDTKDNEFSELSEVNPYNQYALSKYEAELGLKRLSNKYNFELVIIRPPLVYGKNPPGNFAKLLKLSLTKFPMPFGLVNNSRSYISVENLCSFIVLSLEHVKAANELFLLSDDEKYSTKNLIKEVWKLNNIKSFMVPVPVFLFKVLFKILGKNSISTQLFGNLEIDSSKARTLLGWNPKFNLTNTLK